MIYSIPVALGSFLQGVHQVGTPVAGIRQVANQHPKPSAKNEQGEFGKFSRLLDKLLSVPHQKIKDEIESEKRIKKSSRQRAASGHAFGDTD